jgi:hypothetical protein
MMDGVKRPRGLAIALATVLTFGVGPVVSPVQAADAQRLPDLAVLAPFDFKIVFHSSGAKRLRFSSVLVNLGPGPFQMYGYDEDGTAVIGDDLVVRQQVQTTGGSFVDRDTTATMRWGGDGHNHFHVQGLTNLKIHDSAGKEVARSRKVGFCFLDSYRHTSTQPSAYNAASYVCQPAPNGRVPMGISVKWGDIYLSTISWQWIDITALPNGIYRVEVVADPPFATGGRFIEGNEANNRGWTKIRITGTTVTVLSKSAKP